jgi:ubiquitin-protein ligase
LDFIFLVAPLQAGRVNASTASSIRYSCLLPLLTQHFRASSLVDIESHGALYLALLDLTRQLASSPHLLPLFHETVSGGSAGKAAAAGGSTFMAAVKDLCGRYAQLHKSLGYAGDGAAGGGAAKSSKKKSSKKPQQYCTPGSCYQDHNSSDVCGSCGDSYGNHNGHECSDGSGTGMFLASSAHNSGGFGFGSSSMPPPAAPKLARQDSDSEIQVQLIKGATELLAFVEAKLAEFAASGGQIVATAKDAVDSLTGASGSADDEATYVARMDELQRFSFVEDFTGHKFGSHAEDVSRTVLKRVHQEYQDLSRALPVSRSSSVILRAHESKSYLARMIITGPDDTPYSHGCFLFDVMFPNGYPAGPPKVHLQTTGRGSVRFNPNLYNEGKVCLSLLGTWAGPGWDAGTSTFLQVAVSIQALILVGDPYFNEPGYESSMHTPEGKESSRAYNENIRLRTMQWAMLDVLKSPPEHFEDVVAAHFQLKAAAIIKTTRVWVKEARSMKSEFAKAQSELEALLAPFLLSAGKAAAADTSSATAAAASPTGWACDKCTFLNGPLATKCGMCNSSSPALASADDEEEEDDDDGWSCGACTVRNQEDSEVCEVCGTARPDED